MDKTIEWDNRSKYNSFNSFKGLAYYEQYKKIVGWLDGKNALPPPIECNLDPFAECNLSCYFCIVQRYIKNNRAEVGEMRKLPTEYLCRVVDFLFDWGVRGLCLSGGGEPSLHDGTWGLPSYAVDKGLDVSIVTNMVSIHDHLAENMMECRWVAMSIDALGSEMYLKIKGKDRFKEVIANVKKVADLRRKSGSKVDLAFKCLILPENITSLYDICRMARELGVQDFHTRPVDLERKDIEGNKKISFNVHYVNEQLQRCHELETKDFHVYTITHKFDPEFHVKHDFERCFATLILPLLTDGNVYLCVDHKMEKDFLLGSAYPDPENILKWWGGDRHRDMISNMNISKCSRCTGSQYNAQIENVVLQDKMCLSFP